MEPTLDPRDSKTLFVDCHAPEELFVDDWEDLSDDAQTWFDENYLACEGTGDIGVYCIGCPFAKLDVE